MSFKTNKINRAVKFVCHLYFNKDSHNLATDDTPRFYLKPVELKTIERIGFTDESERTEKYGQYGYRYYGGRGEESFNDTQALALFEDVKNNYPFGFVSTDTAGKKRYEQDVKFNAAYQSYYATYWKTHVKDHKTITYDDFGVAEQPHPFIVFENFEIQVRSKHNVGTVPAAAGGLQLDTKYEANNVYYSPPSDVSCSPKVINVSLPPTGAGETPSFEFALNGDEAALGVLNASGTEYVFRFVDPWPKESGNSIDGFSGEYLPYDFRLSTVRDGTHSEWFDILGNVYRSGTEYISGNQGFIEHETVTYQVATTGSPNYGTAFYLDGVHKPILTMKRGSEYRFDQSDVSNSGHPLYIGTDSSGGDKGSGIFCEVQAMKGYLEGDGVNTSDAMTVFRVPMDAPSTLYYQCRNHQGMGQGINIVDPTSTSSLDSANYIPGSGIKIKIPVEVEQLPLYYYSSGTAGMGSFIAVRDWCVHKCEEDQWTSTGGISGAYSYEL
jgi:hypothetical protein